MLPPCAPRTDPSSIAEWRGVRASRFALQVDVDRDLFEAYLYCHISPPVLVAQRWAQLHCMPLFIGLLLVNGYMLWNYPNSFRVEGNAAFVYFSLFYCCKSCWLLPQVGDSFSAWSMRKWQGMYASKDFTVKWKEWDHRGEVHDRFPWHGDVGTSVKNQAAETRTLLCFQPKIKQDS